MYRTLVGDSSCPTNLASEEIDKRVQQFFETEDTDLVIDLRVNNGRPDDKYEIFSPESDDDDLDVLNSIFVIGGLTCASLMEKPFYVACKDLICFQCGAEEMIDETNNVYPLCRRCIASGLRFTNKSSRKVKPKSTGK